MIYHRCRDLSFGETICIKITSTTVLEKPSRRLARRSRRFGSTAQPKKALPHPPLPLALFKLSSTAQAALIPSTAALIMPPA